MKKFSLWKHKCHRKECNRIVEEEEIWCSITCVVLDGYFSVNKGWIKDPEIAKSHVELALIEENNNGRS